MLSQRFVATENDVVVGLAIASLIDHGLEAFGYIDELVVAGEHQGKGIGGALLAACVGWLKQNGAEVTFVSSLHDEAEAFYVSQGFTPCKRPWLVQPLI